MGLEEGVLLARGALSTLNREHRHWMEELRKVCTSIQTTNLQILTKASSDEFTGGLEPMIQKQEYILGKLRELAPQRHDLKRKAWGTDHPPQGAAP